MSRSLRFASMLAVMARTRLTASTDHVVWLFHYLRGLRTTALCTLIAYPVYPSFDPVNIVMIYLLGTTVAALRLGRGPSALTAIANVVAFDFFFVPPRYSFYVAATQYLFTLGVMLSVALVIANLMVSLRRQTFAAQTHNAMDRHRRVTLGQLIEEKARDMSGLLSNVLELMKLESSSGPARPDWQSVEDLVGTAVRSNEHRLNGWILRTDSSADLPLIYANGQLLVQLLSNLLENAIRYTPPGTSILISAQESAGTVSLIVEDDGPGFGTRDPERLFEKFERGKTESSVSGVGLGLAICRAITQLHGDRIKAANRAGGGARFSIEFAVQTHFSEARASVL